MDVQRELLKYYPKLVRKIKPNNPVAYRKQLVVFLKHFFTRERLDSISLSKHALYLQYIKLYIDLKVKESFSEKYQHGGNPLALGLIFTLYSTIWIGCVGAGAFYRVKNNKKRDNELDDKQRDTVEPPSSVKQQTPRPIVVQPRASTSTSTLPSVSSSSLTTAIPKASGVFGNLLNTARSSITTSKFLKS